MYGKLTRSADFRRVYHSGRLKFGRFLAVHALPIDETEVRVGLSVSKKVGKAVVRNKVKRRLRESVMTIYDQLRPGYLIVIGAKARAKDASFWELHEDLLRALQGLDLFGKNNWR